MPDYIISNRFTRVLFESISPSEPGAVDYTDKIESGSQFLRRVLIDSENISFGRACSTMYEVTIWSEKRPRVDGLIELRYGDVTQLNSLIFQGYIYSLNWDTNTYYVENEKTYCAYHIVAYDPIYKVSTINVADWWNAFWQSNAVPTIKNLRNSLIQHVGLILHPDFSFGTKTLPNEDIQLLNPESFSSILFIDMLQYLCEFSACIPYCTKDGYLSFWQLKDCDTATLTNYDTTLSIFENATEPIDKVICVDIAGNIVTECGSGNNACTVIDNVILKVVDMTPAQQSSLLENILDAVDDVSYLLCDVSMILSDASIDIG
ncbi:MAG: hypothetical protein IKO56_07875, partial [Alphaproteobacteria bacterium]|nr:hypothetical protein [Alphaproteobacteria bacterium]